MRIISSIIFCLVVVAKADIIYTPHPVPSSPLPQQVTMKCEFPVINTSFFILYWKKRISNNSYDTMFSRTSTNAVPDPGYADRIEEHSLDLKTDASQGDSSHTLLFNTTLCDGKSSLYLCEVRLSGGNQPIQYNKTMDFKDPSCNCIFGDGSSNSATEGDSWPVSCSPTGSIEEPTKLLLSGSAQFSSDQTVTDTSRNTLTCSWSGKYSPTDNITFDTKGTTVIGIQLEYTDGSTSTCPSKIITVNEELTTTPCPPNDTGCIRESETSKLLLLLLLLIPIVIIITAVVFCRKKYEVWQLNSEYVTKWDNKGKCYVYKVYGPKTDTHGPKADTPRLLKKGWKKEFSDVKIVVVFEKLAFITIEEAGNVLHGQIKDKKHGYIVHGSYVDNAFKMSTDEMDDYASRAKELKAAKEIQISPQNMIDLVLPMSQYAYVYIGISDSLQRFAATKYTGQDVVLGQTRRNEILLLYSGGGNYVTMTQRFVYSTNNTDEKNNEIIHLFSLIKDKQNLVKSSKYQNDLQELWRISEELNLFQKVVSHKGMGGDEYYGLSLNETIIHGELDENFRRMKYVAIKRNFHDQLYKHHFDNISRGTFEDVPLESIQTMGNMYKLSEALEKFFQKVVQVSEEDSFTQMLYGLTKQGMILALTIGQRGMIHEYPPRDESFKEKKRLIDSTEPVQIKSDILYEGLVQLHKYEERKQQGTKMALRNRNDSDYLSLDEIPMKPAYDQTNFV